MAATPPSDIPGPVGPIIPTLPPPPPISSPSLPGAPSSRSVLPGSILSISQTSGAPSSSFSSQPSLLPSPTSTPTESQPVTSGTDSTSTSTSAAPTSISTMTSVSSSAVPVPPSTSPTSVIPPATAASHNSNDAGAIAGGVIGGVAFVVLVLGALFFLWRRHNRKKSQKTILPWSNNRRRGDVRISSSSGLAGAGAGDRTSGYGFAKRMSSAGFGMGSAGVDPKGDASADMMLGRQTHALSASSHTHVNSQSHDDFGMFYSEDEEEKNSTLQNHDSYSHHNKSIDLNETSMVPHLPMEPPSAYAYDRQRSRSMTGQNRALTLARLDGTAVARSPSGASQHDPFASPTTEQKRSSGGATHRRPTQRKAVPKYDKSEFSMAELSSPTSPTSNPTSSPAVQARGVSPFQTQTLSRASSTEAMHSTASHGSNTNLNNTPLPALNHKTSFGDMRPVHYLIPDLPPPQKD